MSQTRLLAGLLGECHDSALAQLCGKQDESNMPNAPFRKYQTSGFAFEAYSFAIHNVKKGVLTTLNTTPLNLNLHPYFFALRYSVEKSAAYSLDFSYWLCAITAPTRTSAVFVILCSAAICGSVSTVPTYASSSGQVAL